MRSDRTVPPRKHRVGVMYGDANGFAATQKQHERDDRCRWLGTKSRRRWVAKRAVAEREGFEPPLGCPKPDFESGAFDHSAISPSHTIIPTRVPAPRELGKCA